MEKKYKSIRQFDNSILQIACINTFRDIIKNNEIKENNLDLSTYIVSMENGFYEDCIDIIIKVFSSITTLKLYIVVPNFNDLMILNYQDHNYASKYNKSYTTLLKHQKDYLLLLKLISEEKLNDRISIINKNLNIVEMLMYIKNSAGFISISRTMNNSPLVFASLLLNKKVFVNHNSNLLKQIKEYCYTIDCEEKLVSEEFSLPVDCENISLRCLKPSKDDLYNKLINSDKTNLKKKISTNLEQLTEKEILNKFTLTIKENINPIGLKMFVEH